LDEGIAEIREAVRSDPDSAESHRDLGRLYERKGDSRSALIEYGKAYKLDPILYDADSAGRNAGISSVFA
jgi:Flp pilus assembly protein TadD